MDSKFTMDRESPEKRNGIQLGASIIGSPLRGATENGSAPTEKDYGDDRGLDGGCKRKKSLAQLTWEALPRMDNYRNSRRAVKRPSLGQLHGDHAAAIAEECEKAAPRDTKSPTPVHGGIKLGWIQGVLIPCLLNIWGVMLFLRISWVVSQAGMGLALVIVLVSFVVCVITALSMSAISSNGEVKGGGIYYIISRSLGPEMGASVGVIFAFANAVSATMNTIGFCDSLNDLLLSYGVKIVDNGDNDTRIVGTVALVVMCVICAVGMEWESKAQNFLIVIIVAAIGDFIVGTLIGPRGDVNRMAKGFVGLNFTVMKSNWMPDFRFSEGTDQNFFSVFAIFFPSVTGIQAGANISGDLKDPGSAIPKGTLLSLLISMLSYVLMVLFSGSGALRDASGNSSDVQLIFDPVTNATSYDYSMVSACTNCTYGLHNSYSVMQLMSVWGWLIYAGCFAATLSTALTNLLSVPRLIQALGVDRIYPGLIYFSKGYGKSGEPYRGYVLTFLVSMIGLMYANLNAIAPLISTFYLASYALINFCTFHAALVRPLGWRPTFKYYNVWVSLAGFLICVSIMFLINWGMSLLTVAIFLTLYFVVHYRKPDVNWGSSAQAQRYKSALSSAYVLAHTGEHVKNYWPQVLVLSGPAYARPALIDLAHSITKSGSLMVAADISQRKLSHNERAARFLLSDSWLQERKVRAFFAGVDGFNFESGARALVQAGGVGKLAPNILLMGFKSDWQTAAPTDLLYYFNILHNAFDNRLSVAILRMPDGLHYGAVAGGDSLAISGGLPSTPTASSLTGISADSNHLRLQEQVLHADSDLDIHQTANKSHKLQVPGLTPTSRSFTLNEKEKSKEKKKNESYGQVVYQTPSGQELSNEQFLHMTLFQRKKTEGTLDVWWLYDDGGLTILLPYILSLQSAWSGTKLRVFALASKRLDLQLEQRNMANLLSKFRIKYSTLTMVTDVMEEPQPDTIASFHELIKDFRENTAVSEECGISDAELATLAEKTNRQLRLRELLLANSREAQLIVMSLPMPRKGSISAPLYMAWLEMTSKDLPPMLLIRGNQTSVLTFYS